MPTSSRSASKAVAASSPATAAKSKMDEDSLSDVESVPVAKSSRAKASSKVVSSKSAKKRAREEDSESSDEEEFSPVKKSPKTASSVRAAPKRASGKKASAAKKSSVVMDEDSDASFSSEDDETPKKAASAKRATGKKATGGKKASSSKKEEESDEEDSAEGEPMAVEATDFSQPKKAPFELKIVSWNVASYNNVLKKGFEQYMKDEDPDIVCLQETKVKSSEGPTKFGHSVFYGCVDRPGLHGTGILSKVKPLSVTCELDDNEGRCIVAEFETFFIINTYVPNSGRKLERLPYRLEWDKKLQTLFLGLQKKKPVIWCGDLNVAQHPIDLANPSGNKRTAGFTEQERASFTKFCAENGLVDAYRSRHPDEKDCYSFWSHMRQARSKNIGWRLDYFIVSPAIDSAISQSYIRKHVQGSDHCPIVIHFKP